MPTSEDTPATIPGTRAAGATSVCCSGAGRTVPGPHSEIPQGQREGGVSEEHRRVKCPRVFP